jgi:uncharacterized membrane protein YukC
LGVTKNNKLNPFSRFSKQETTIKILQELKEIVKELLISNNNAFQKKVDMPPKEHHMALRYIAKTQAPKLGSHQPCNFTSFNK